MGVHQLMPPWVYRLIGIEVGSHREKGHRLMHDELAYLSATDTLVKCRSRELSPLELLDAVW